MILAIAQSRYYYYGFTYRYPYRVAATVERAGARNEM